MDDLLVPDRPAGQRSNMPEPEPSCCSPIRGKLNTTPIKLQVVMYLWCGVVLIGLGVVACILDCLFKGLSIPAGVLFIATATVGLLVNKHGGLAIAYGCLNAFSFMFATAVVVFMLIALPLRESDYHYVCSSHDCYDPWDHHNTDNCCEDWIFDMKWKNVAVDLAILVVGLIVMVTSYLACTLSLRDLNWINICFLKKEEQPQTNPTQTTQDGSVDEQSMKRCWKPCDNKCHNNVSIAMAIIHIIIGVICVGLGGLAFYFGCRYYHIGMPIWTGILIFIITGIFGLMSVYKKGLYIPCYFALSILAFLLAINMFTWAAANISDEEQCYYGCVQWGCNDTTTSPYYSYGRNCYDCLPGCCYNGDICDHDKETYRMWVDGFVIGFGILEMLICMVTIGLSFSQLSCYVCFRGCCCDCSCCRPKTNGPYQMVMTSDGNMMMVPVQNAQVIPMVRNQPMVMMPQQQPMVYGSSQTPVTGGLPSQQQIFVQGQIKGQPMLVHGQPMLVQGQPLMIQGQQPFIVQQVPTMEQGAVVQGQKQPAAQTCPDAEPSGDSMTQVPPPQIQPAGDSMTQVPPPQIQPAGGSMTQVPPPQFQPAGGSMTQVPSPQFHGAFGGVPDQEILSNPTA